MSKSIHALALTRAPRALLSCAVVAIATFASPASHAATGTENYALAISWEPEFCYSNKTKPECVSETQSRWDATHFSLHGLWPQSGSYCGVSATQKSEDENGQWTLLPAVVLQSATEAELKIEEPGTQSDLDRHEWTEHGTCSGYTQQNFFAPTLAMLDGINASNLGTTVSANVGKSLTLAQLQTAAALDYGSKAKTDIEYLCTFSGSKSYLEEVRFHMHLPSPLPTSVLSSYMAKPIMPASSSQLCKSGTPITISLVSH